MLVEGVFQALEDSGVHYRGTNTGVFVTGSPDVHNLGNDMYDMGPYSARSEEHTSELQSRDSISYAVFCLKKKDIGLNLSTNIIHPGFFHHRMILIIIEEMIECKLIQHI